MPPFAHLWAHSVSFSLLTFVLLHLFSVFSYENKPTFSCQLRQMTRCHMPIVPPVVFPALYETSCVSVAQKQRNGTWPLE